MNEIANLCERVGADVDIVRKGIGSDQRIGPAFLFPGPGYGGSCFPKDVKALVQTARDASTLRCACSRRSKRSTTTRSSGCSRSCRRASAAAVAGERIAVWGLAFKPNTDDMREAPALVAHRGAARARARRSSRTTRSRCTRRSADSAIAVEFADVELRRARRRRRAGRRHRLERVPRIRTSRGSSSCCAAPVVFDGRNLYDARKMRALGFTYDSIGRGSVA